MQESATAIFQRQSPQHSKIKSPTVTRNTPTAYRRDRTVDSNVARPLVELTGNPELYPYLHSAFTYTLKASLVRLKEIPAPYEMSDDFSKSEQFNKSILNDQSSDSDCKFRSLRHMRDVLQPSLFKANLWHLLMGNQVIWRSQNEEIVTSALNVLKEVLPEGCVKMLTSSDVYVNSYKANLLGLTEKAILPPHMKSSEYYVFVDVTFKTSPSYKVNQLYPDLFSSDSFPLSINTAEYKMTSGCVIPERGPDMLHKLEAALANTSLSLEVVRHCLICLKEEWMK